MYLQKATYRKYKNTKSEYKGSIYHSKLEAEHAMWLDGEKKAKRIKDWQRQVKISLDVNGHHITNYYMDFVVEMNDGNYEHHEIKGYETDTWRLKMKLYEAVYLEEHPEVEYVVYKQQSIYKARKNEL